MKLSPAIVHHPLSPSSSPRTMTSSMNPLYVYLRSQQVEASSMNTNKDADIAVLYGLVSHVGKLLAHPVFPATFPEQEERRGTSLFINSHQSSLLVPSNHQASPQRLRKGSNKKSSSIITPTTISQSQDESSTPRKGK